MRMNLSAGLCLIVASIVPGLAFGQAGDNKGPPPAPEPPPPGPEVKKTVDAFVGTWVFIGTLTPPAKEYPVPLKETFVCRKVAGGAAVACTGKGTVAGSGSLADAALIGWDVEGKVLRFVGVSAAEFHDHRCTWKDDKTMACEPLSLTAYGQPATVELDISFTSAKTMVVHEITTMKDGMMMVFEGRGTRK